MKQNVWKTTTAAVGTAALLMLSMAGCGGRTTGQATADGAETPAAETAVTETVSAALPTKDSITVSETFANSADGEHAITADGETVSYANIAVTKTGDSGGDEADFYGENAAVFATDGATLELSQIVVTTDGTHANGVFSYGQGTTVNISDSVIETTGNCSGGLMTTADITVSDAVLTSTASQGVVVEGQNSVTLHNVTLTADNNTKNSDKSDWYQAVMIYQSMSGDADEGTASFTMNGGSLTNKNGDVFFVNNTVATIDLSGVTIDNQGDGVFLRAAAAGWGTAGSNGGNVTLTAAQQTIRGDMVVDDVSTLNLYLTDGSTFTGAINADGEAGRVYVELTGGSKWVLTGDSYITALTCDLGSIDLNGHTLCEDLRELQELPEVFLYCSAYLQQILNTPPLVS